MWENIKSILKGVFSTEYKTYKGLAGMLIYTALINLHVVDSNEVVWATLATLTGVGVRAAVGRVANATAVLVEAMRFLIGLNLQENPPTGTKSLQDEVSSTGRSNTEI